MTRTKRNIINFPTRATAVGEDDAFWMIAISSGLKDEYSCEYDTKNDWWKITIKAGTREQADSLVEKCRHILGWDTKEIENASTN